MVKCVREARDVLSYSLTHLPKRCPYSQGGCTVRRRPAWAARTDFILALQKAPGTGARSASQEARTASNRAARRAFTRRYTTQWVLIAWRAGLDTSFQDRQQWLRDRIPCRIATIDIPRISGAQHLADLLGGGDEEHVLSVRGDE